MEDALAGFVVTKAEQEGVVFEVFGADDDLTAQLYAYLRDDSLKRASEVAGKIVDEAIRKKQKDKISS